MGFSVGTSVVPFPISNRQFLEAGFGQHWDCAWVTSFAGDTGAGDWRSFPAGQPTAGVPLVEALPESHNNYFGVGLSGVVAVPYNGKARTIADFIALNVIVIDDCWVKVDIDRAITLLGQEPSYVIETSPGNYQAGWFIDGISDRAWVVGMLRGLQHALGAGDNLTNPVTLMRLPVGTNCKSTLARNFRTKLVHWTPTLRIARTDWGNIERRIGAVIPAHITADGDNSMPDVAALDADVVLRVLRARGMVLDQGRPMPMGWGYEVECPWASGHTDLRNAASYIPVKERFKCHHGHCGGHNMGSLRAWADEAVREDSGGLVTLASLEFDELADAGPGTSKIHGASIAWRNHWQRAGANGQGAPISNAANILVALELAPELSGCCGFNGFNLRETLLRELPGVGPGTTPGVPRAWRDVDTVILQCWLQRQGLATISTKMVDDAVNQVMHARSYHPVRDWLERLVWDQTPRLDTWVERYLGVAPSPYAAHVGRWWLMTMCRRVFEPGCRADYMPVLEGPQGQEKSSLLRTLAGDAWFSDALPDIANKDVSDHMVGRWLIEVAEMDRFNSAESAAMKAFVSRTTERYRRAYAKRTADEPRQGVLAGTVNHASYLKDETGNRRYWPIAAGAIDVPGLALVRDQLFAEAWHRAVVLNEPYWPDPVFEELFIQPEQDARLETDPWDHLVAQYLATRAQALVYEVIVAVTGGGSAQLTTTNRNRVIRIMETLRWRRGKRGNNGERFWYPALAATSV